MVLHRGGDTSPEINLAELVKQGVAAPGINGPFDRLKWSEGGRNVSPVKLVAPFVLPAEVGECREFSIGEFLDASDCQLKSNFLVLDGRTFPN